MAAALRAQAPLAAAVATGVTAWAPRFAATSLRQFASSASARASASASSSSASSSSAAAAGAGAAAAAAGSSKYDVVVVGGGPGGYVAAIKAAQLGLKTACVEKRGSLGGTCLNVGCIPSKALLHSSHLFEEASHTLGTHGVKFDGKPQVDLPAMMKQKERSVTGLTKGVEGLFKKNKVDYVKGAGALTGANEVTVDGDRKLSTSNVLIATGSAAVDLPMLPLDEERVVSSTGAIALKQVPKSMAVIGGGYIGLEMGSVWRRLGADVTVIEYADRIVPAVDHEIGDSFLKTLKKQKLKFKLGTKVVDADTSSADKVRLELEPAQGGGGGGGGGGSREQLDAEVVLVATGRRPYTDGLGLESVGIEVDKGGRVSIDDNFRTSLSNVYAIGDVVRGPMLAHKAEDEGLLCAEIIAGKAGHLNYDCIPGVVYTHPEVATVGKSEEQLKEAGVAYNKGVFPFQANSRARTNDAGGDFASGMVKMLAAKDTDQLLGVHMVGPNVGEMIAEAVLAMEYGASSEDLARTSHAHPTLSEAVREAAMATYDKSIHY